jgi:hypothetical protein
MNLSKFANVLSGSIFGVSGVAKMIEQSVLVTPTLVETRGNWLYDWLLAIELGLPYIECLVAASLIIEVAPISGRILAALLSGGFLVVALLLPENMNCGCFGVLGGFEGRMLHVGLATLLLILIFAGALNLGASTKQLAS